MFPNYNIKIVQRKILGGYFFPEFGKQILRGILLCWMFLKNCPLGQHLWGTKKRKKQNWVEREIERYCRPGNSLRRPCRKLWSERSPLELFAAELK